MSSLRLLSASAITLALMMYSGNAMGCGELKCPFTGSPPNYECPPAFKAIPGMESSGATIEIIGITAGAATGDSCQVTVIGLTRLMSVSEVNILDFDSRLPLAGFEPFRPNEDIAKSFAKGLDGNKQKILGYGSARLRPQSFSSRVTSEIYSGKTIVVEIKYQVESRTQDATPESMANILLGNTSVITGKVSKDGLPHGHTSWQKITRLERHSDKHEK